MTDKVWKQRERTGARFFGVERNPSSGIMSGHTHSDSLHERLYIEQKSTKKSAIHTLHKDAKRKADGEGKTPVILHHPVGYKGFYVIVHSSNMPVVVCEYLAARGYGLSPDEIPVDPDLPQEDNGAPPVDGLWENGLPSNADPYAYLDELQGQLAYERADSARFCLYTLGLLSHEENGRVGRRIKEWCDFHEEEDTESDL